ncbi:BrnA antitoxin family protein [Plasticicumulans sp.]|uniref:BrnA antitoxin family protein n=1 Tax=Plasticicumulans sp. TaxID=2307179 RepID=UPI002B9C714F|nr:BrnA antitoxin family protein [Plasticicumulans sp.]HNF64600.1 BrnA antitoxin family protein [Plasticicumulans sp.]HNK32239.1 BrnA antitoxin family protein [Plasticicumulans sp.]HNM42692.1 BrnA antitoxin family protein [Plasticicumulans sp.]
MSASHTKPPSATDWARLQAMTDDDIDFSDDPERDAHFLAQAVILPGPKKQITLRIDADVLGYFREQGRGYQTLINRVLRKYVEAQKNRA